MTQLAVKDIYIKLLHAEFSKTDDLNLTPRDIEEITKHVFFVNSHYRDATAHEGDMEAFIGLRNWCLTCGHIDRGLLEEGVRAVHEVCELCFLVWHCVHA